jgi:hypothetical protein
MSFIPVTMFRYLSFTYICLSYELGLRLPPPPGFLLGLFFIREERSDMLLRNSGFSGNYTAVQPERSEHIWHSISQDSNFQSPQWKPQITRACALNVSRGLMSIGKPEPPLQVDLLRVSLVPTSCLQSVHILRHRSKCSFYATDCNLCF